MEFYMLVLALDTTTRQGSVALVRDGVVLDVYEGDAGVTHGERLPGDLIRMLDRQHIAVGDVDLFAVAAGPGSFTGLRIGIATMQGLAFANGKGVIGVSALDALHHASHSPLAPRLRPLTGQVGVWMDAHRGEVFSAFYEDGVVVDGPSVEKPDDVLARWRCRGSSGPTFFVGQGAVMYAELVRQALPQATVEDGVPALAPSIAQMAAQQAREHPAPSDTIRPIYVRRPDAELARDRKAGLSAATGVGLAFRPADSAGLKPGPTDVLKPGPTDVLKPGPTDVLKPVHTDVLKPGPTDVK
jgi:tRNA threonylcarbamoyladenosine biosynthesis protein TsaB